MSAWFHVLLLLHLRSVSNDRILILSSLSSTIVLRTVAENRIRWAFWPPGVRPKRAITKGIWIVETGDAAEVHSPYVDLDEDDESEEDDDEKSDDVDEGDEENENEEDEEDLPIKKGAQSKFGLLAS